MEVLRVPFTNIQDENNLWVTKVQQKVHLMLLGSGPAFSGQAS